MFTSPDPESDTWSNLPACLLLAPLPLGKFPNHRLPVDNVAIFSPAPSHVTHSAARFSNLHQLVSHLSCAGMLITSAKGGIAL